MIKLKDMLPADLFKSAWGEVERLVADNRWRIFDHVAGEIHGETIQEWLRRNADAVVPFDEQFNAYLNRFMIELDLYGIHMINPQVDKDGGDPFVITLALMLERRDLSDLRKRTTGDACCVLTNEAPKKNKVNIPHVCDIYGLPHMNLFDFMRHHGWEISLTVKHPE
ncbi:MAG: hypothetical protein BWY76_00943 [bacterium ADurb.Bin429]|nr:MAG: hypothetical protein BWY76_00943 [bacterium ADurb.Bin429]